MIFSPTPDVASHPARTSLLRTRSAGDRRVTTEAIPGGRCTAGESCSPTGGTSSCTPATTTAAAATAAATATTANVKPVLPGEVYFYPSSPPKYSNCLCGIEIFADESIIFASGKLRVIYYMPEQLI